MNPRRDRILLAALLLLNLVPAVAGVSRLTSLATGANITPDNGERIFPRTHHRPRQSAWQWRLAIESCRASVRLPRRADVEHN
jgi:hypothetical protein